MNAVPWQDFELREPENTNHYLAKIGS